MLRARHEEEAARREEEEALLSMLRAELEAERAQRAAAEEARRRQLLTSEAAEANQLQLRLKVGLGAPPGREGRGGPGRGGGGAPPGGGGWGSWEGGGDSWASWSALGPRQPTDAGPRGYGRGRAEQQQPGRVRAQWLVSRRATSDACLPRPPSHPALPPPGCRRSAWRRSGSASPSSGGACWSASQVGPNRACPGPCTAAPCATHHCGRGRCCRSTGCHASPLPLAWLATPQLHRGSWFPPLARSCLSQLPPPPPFPPWVPQRTAWTSCQLPPPLDPPPPWVPQRRTAWTS